MYFALGMSALGLAAGILSGVFGIGGGILIIPALVYLAGMEQKLAQGTTLLMMLPPIGFLAAREYFMRGEADWRAALWICAGFLIGGYFGARFSGGLSSEMLKRGFGILLLVAGLHMLVRP